MLSHANQSWGEGEGAESALHLAKKHASSHLLTHFSAAHRARWEAGNKHDQVLNSGRTPRPVRRETGFLRHNCSDMLS